MIGSIVVSSLLGMAAHFGEPTATADSFTMPVKQGIILLVKGHKTVTETGEVVIFAQGLTGESLDRDIATGPVKHVRVRELPRGLAVVLTPSDALTADSITMAQGKLTVTAPALAAPMKSAKAVEMPVVEAAPVAVVSAVEPVKAPVVVTEKPVFKAESTSNPLRNLMVMAAFVAAAAIAVVMGKKRKVKAKHGPSSGIDLIAVRQLGPKQRLAVVEAGGDRLLIASTENGVQLLSRLTGVHQPVRTTQSSNDDDFAALLQEATAPTFAEEPIIAPVTKGNRRSADVAGLVKLRAARATWNQGD